MDNKNNLANEQVCTLIILRRTIVQFYWNYDDDICYEAFNSLVTIGTLLYGHIHHYAYSTGEINWTVAKQYGIHFPL